MTAAHELLGAWESYYVILGSSAAALTGLQFVVMALIADSPGQASTDSVNAFGTPTVVHFCLCLFVAAVLSAPWPGMSGVIWLLAATGILGIVYTLIVLRRARRQSIYVPVMEDWFWHSMLPLLGYAALVIGAVLLATDPEVALFIVAAVVIELILVGIHNAWDSVAYVTVQRRSKAQE